MKFKFILVLACTLSGYAFADDGSKNPCQQPVQPNRLASEQVVKSFNKHSTAYIACIKKFVDDQRELAKNATNPASANEANEAAEAAIAEHNAFMDKVKATNDSNEENE